MRKIIIIILTVIFSINNGMLSNKVRAAREASASVFADLPEVVHGLGYINGHFVTNSLEALEANYQRGFRIFEVDLNMTSDNRLVARHDWSLQHYEWLGQEVPTGAVHNKPLSFETAMSLTIHGQYHPVSWEQLLAFMQKHHDIYLVTDTKFKDEENVRRTFSYLVTATKKVDHQLLDRIIPQIYDRPMLATIQFYHPFKEVIYTLYQHSDEDFPRPKDLAEWCAANHVTTVAGFPFRLTEDMRQELQARQITIYTHTINDPDLAADYRAKHIGVYTDYLYYNGEEFVAP